MSCLLACAHEQCQIQAKNKSSLAALSYDTEWLYEKDAVCWLAKHAAVKNTDN